MKEVNICYVIEEGGSFHKFGSIKDWSKIADFLWKFGSVVIVNTGERITTILEPGTKPKMMDLLQGLRHLRKNPLSKTIS